MAKTATFVGAMSTVNFLSDEDWVTIISALLRDGSGESQRLAKELLNRTKHGRQIRLVKLIMAKRPTTTQMQKALKMSRRTIFRYLNGLEDYGVHLTIADDYRYDITKLPVSFKRLLSRVPA